MWYIQQYKTEMYRFINVTLRNKLSHTGLIAYLEQKQPGRAPDPVKPARRRRWDSSCRPSRSVLSSGWSWNIWKSEAHSFSSHETALQERATDCLVMCSSITSVLPPKMSARARPASCDSPAPCRLLSGGLIDWHTGGGEECGAILTVTETTSGVEHARLTQPKNQAADTTTIRHHL